MKQIGSEGEALAVEHLKEKGYKIIEKNYKTPIGEIDIIAEDKNTVVFVEVKTRSSDFFGCPFEAVGAKKQQKLKSLALFYLKQKGKELPARFDVLSIYLKDGKEEIQHIKDAFEVQ